MLLRRIVLATILAGILGRLSSIDVLAAPPKSPSFDLVKVAAVQISGYDKGDRPRANYDPTESIIPYINRAGEDGAQLIVFPEYVLGHIPVPGPTTRKISAAAAANRIYVIVGCWEVYDDASFANTALIFDRTGVIIGKYHKTHAAVDKFEGTPAWSKPPSDKSRDWFIENDPEWIMERGQELPVFNLDFGKVGIMTCYDGWFPEPARILSLKGRGTDRVDQWPRRRGRGFHREVNHVSEPCRNDHGESSIRQRDNDWRLAGPDHGTVPRQDRRLHHGDDQPKANPRCPYEQSQLPTAPDQNSIRSS